MSVITSLAPLPAGATFTSPTQFVQRATQITGTVFADQAGTLQVEQSGDGIHWDFITAYAVAASTGFGFELDVITQYWQVLFTNTSGTMQTVFRLFADPRDPYGDFFAATEAPSSGGAYVVLVANSTGGYSYVGRFNGADGWAANQGAAVSLNQSGKYASFLVDTATVSDEALMVTTEHTPDAF